jgi:hypothetical protein
LALRADEDPFITVMLDVQSSVHCLEPQYD